MEEYSQYLKSFCSQMNDVEDQAAKISIEEQLLIATFQALETDLSSKKSITKQLKEDTENMTKQKGRICSLILEKQKRKASLESDLSTRTQTLNLLQKERDSFSAKLVEKRAYYANIVEDVRSKLQQQKDWVKNNMAEKEQKMIGDKTVRLMAATKGMHEAGDYSSMGSVEADKRKALMISLDSAKAKLDEVAGMKAKITLENVQIKQSLEQVKSRANTFKPELLALDETTLEEEHKALLSDKEAEDEYMQSLRDQIQKLKRISHVIKCDCGEEYKVDMESST